MAYLFAECKRKIILCVKKNVKLIFLKNVYRYCDKCCFCSDEEKKGILFPSQSELSYAVATGDTGHVMAGVVHEVTQHSWFCWASIPWAVAVRKPTWALALTSLCDREGGKRFLSPPCMFL